VPGAVEPHEIERKAHPERVHRPAPRQQQRAGRAPPEREAEQPGDQAAGDEDLHAP